MAGPDFGFRNLDFRFLILDLWLWIGPKRFLDALASLDFTLVSESVSNS